MSLPPTLAPFYSAVTGVIRDPTLHDMTLRQLAIMMVVANKAPGATFSIREVHNILGMSKPAITRGCSLLENKGLLTRKFQPQDKRLVTLELTKAGSAYLARMAQETQYAMPPAKAA